MKTTVNFYRFDISKEDQEKQYSELCHKLRDIGLKPFRTIRANYFQHEKFIKKLKSFDEIELDTDWITDNQWNTTENSGGLRVMDWNEDIVPNKSIKDGYWLTQTDEMKEIRKVTYKCGYCGKLYSIYNLPEKEICNACIGSQYLEQDNFDLLKLVSVVDKDNNGKPILNKTVLNIKKGI